MDDKEIEQAATILAIDVGNGSIGLPAYLVNAVMAMPERQSEARSSEKAKPPKGRAVALSTTWQELFVVSEGC